MAAQVLEPGGYPGAGGGAQPVAQPGCAVEGLVGAVAEGQAAELADGAVVRGVGEANFVGAQKVLEQAGALGAGQRLRRNTAPQRMVRLVCFVRGRTRGGLTARLCPTQDRHFWPLKMAPRKLGPWSGGGASRLRCSDYPQFRV